MLRPAIRSAVRYRPSTATIAALVCAMLIAGRALRGSAFPAPVSRAGRYVVADVDADGTLLLASGQRVRLLGVRIPDRLQPEAAAMIGDFAAGRGVTLELDRERIDQQYRTLAYVHVGGQLLNAEVIRAGCGAVDRRIPLHPERLGEMEAAEEQAREVGVGIRAGR